MKSRYVCTWSANVGDINRNKLRFGYEMSDLGKYSGFGYPDIRVPVEITSINSFFMYIRIKCRVLPLGGLFAFWD